MDLQDLTEEAADLLQAPATLEDRDFHLVAYAPHGTTIDPVRMNSILHRRSTREVREYFERFGITRATDPVRIPRDEKASLLARLCLPVRWNDVTYGYLWLLDDEEKITPKAAAQTTDLRAQAGLLMARQARERGDQALRFAELLSPDREISQRAATDLNPETPAVVAVLRTTTPEILNPWQLPKGVLTTTKDEDHVLLIPQSKTPKRVTQKARSLLEERGTTVTTGTSAPANTPQDIKEAWHQARTAAHTTPTGETTTWNTLGTRRLLRWSEETNLRTALETPEIKALQQNPTLTRTALLYLNNAGNIKQTAATLKIHRQTLYHRLTKIEELTKTSMTNGQDRLTLHLALTLLPHL
ncbi:PucR family transcriptional regulator [Actinomadura flavalba]|uniref:PucR family transcriptional regulator n=1 Tax=Actinomadura flavalba TaxID=1120938 RepID=UPI0003A27D03|nr:PucR family transcriptional regulator [Actinomadura flavalba]